ncbi:MAG: patatin-like phospholipase family protein [Flavobacteriaceae bacterium]|nr:patatin-like phospholipase family protein [Flavobacteriaceae bacterium]
MKISELKNKKTGIVLSGGGVKAGAHIGVLKALTERKIYPEVVSGVSAGAIVGALYANDVGAEEMLKFFKETPLLKYNFFTLNKPGLFDTDRYREFLEVHFKENNFEALKRALHIVATNLEDGCEAFFNSGKLIEPILASAALPPVFSPVKFNNVLYIDGGVMNNFPIEPLQNKCDFIIGCYTSSMVPVSKKNLNSSLKLTTRTNVLMIHANSAYKLSIPDILFRPNNLDDIGVLDKKGLEKAYNIGYEHANSMLDNYFKS